MSKAVKQMEYTALEQTFSGVRDMVADRTTPLM